MREIKFRGWHRKQKKMYSAEEMGQDQLTLMPDGKGFANIHSVNTKLSQVDKNRRIIPLQFTGLKDKNGKEIYEGDILQIFGENYEVKIINTESRYFVDYGYPDKHNGPAPYWVEIIDNIYENPKLLK